MAPWNTYFRTCTSCKFWKRNLANRNGICVIGVFPAPMMEYETCGDYTPVKKYGSIE